MKQKTFTQTALACLLTGLVSAQSALRIGQNYLNVIPESKRSIATTIVLLYLLGLLIYTFTRVRKNASDPFKSLSALAFWQGALRYLIAFDLCVFGISKFFDIQFTIPLGWLSTPFGSLAPHDLLFAFYGKYPVFARIIGVMQIAGALMLLFKRTRLAGVLFLLPIVLNLVLLNAFYLRGTLYYVIILSLGLIYLLLIEYKRLKQFFFIDHDDLPRYGFKSTLVKNALRASVIIFPFVLMGIHGKPRYFADINGEYAVETLTINDEVKNLDSRKDSILTRVFIDKGDFVFEYNSYKRRFIGDYTYNPATKELKAWWHWPRSKHDTLFAKILTGIKPGTKIMEWRMGNEALRIEMVKATFKQ